MLSALAHLTCLLLFCSFSAPQQKQARVEEVALNGDENPEDPLTEEEVRLPLHNCLTAMSL